MIVGLWIKLIVIIQINAIGTQIINIAIYLIALLLTNKLNAITFLSVFGIMFWNSVFNMNHVITLIAELNVAKFLNVPSNYQRIPAMPSNANK